MRDEEPRTIIHQGVTFGEKSRHLIKQEEPEARSGRGVVMVAEDGMCGEGREKRILPTSTSPSLHRTYALASSTVMLTPCRRLTPPQAFRKL